MLDGAERTTRAQELRAKAIRERLEAQAAAEAEDAAGRAGRRPARLSPQRHHRRSRDAGVDASQREWSPPSAGRVAGEANASGTLSSSVGSGDMPVYNISALAIGSAEFGPTSPLPTGPMITQDVSRPGPLSGKGGGNEAADEEEEEEVGESAALKLKLGAYEAAAAGRVVAAFGIGEDAAAPQSGAAPSLLSRPMAATGEALTGSTGLATLATDHPSPTASPLDNTGNLSAGSGSFVFNFDEDRPSAGGGAAASNSPAAELPSFAAGSRGGASPSRSSSSSSSGSAAPLFAMPGVTSAAADPSPVAGGIASSSASPVSSVVESIATATATSMDSSVGSISLSGSLSANLPDLSWPSHTNVAAGGASSGSSGDGDPYAGDFETR